MDRLEQGNPWYVYYSGRMSGPISRHDTLRLASDGKLGPHDLVWTVGFPDWMAARDVQGLYKPPPLPPGLSTAPSDGPTNLKTNAGREHREDLRESNRPSGLKTRGLQPVRSTGNERTGNERTDGKTRDTNGTSSRPDETADSSKKEAEEKSTSRVSAIAVATKPDEKPDVQTGRDSDQSEPAEATNDVREVLEALLSDSDASPDDKADLDSKKRKDGLLDQIVKRIRDNDSPAPRAVVMPKPETGKLPT